jgi:hypothetical protein
MNKVRAALLLAGATGLLGAGLSAPALAATGSAATICNLEVLSLENFELEDNDGRDEIKVQLASTVHGPWNFWDGTFRSTSLNSPDRNFSGTLTVSLQEQDVVSKRTIDSFVTTCALGDHTVALTDNDGVYEMKYRIT